MNFTEIKYNAITFWRRITSKKLKKIQKKKLIL
jgi:hypothetical protein